MRRPKSISTAKVSGQVLLCTLAASAGWAQQPTAIGHTSAREVQVSGAVEMHGGEMMLGNGSAITAGADTVEIKLTRGGDLRLCATTEVHLSHDRTVDAPDSSALMMALDRGAIEAHYDIGKYSDVLLTPDLRILISPPGRADISVRVNARGDTCIDNQGANAPYITVTSQFDGGLYRLHPDQHVTFEHGSLRDVVDTEKEPCGCPPAQPVSVADSGTTSTDAAAPGQRVGGPSSTPADTTFPLAESEGLAPPPPLPTTPVAKQGEVHVQVTVPLTYNGDASPGGNAAGATVPGSGPASGPAASPATDAANAPTTQPAHATPSTTPTPAYGTVAQAPSPAASQPAASRKSSSDQTRQGESQPGFFHRVGHFFSRIFGGG